MSGPTPTATIPKGSVVLITGITGFVASHTAKQFLERGYKVRGTVRDLDAAAWLLRDAPFEPYATSGDLELVRVPDMGADDAFVAAAKGVSAVLHIATSTFTPDPNVAIPAAVRGVTNALEAAAREPAVRAFVFTSSIVTAADMFSTTGDDIVAGPDSWNDAAVEAAWAPPPYEADRTMAVYMASKVESEKAIWRFADERKPHFTLNAVNPASIIGLPLSAKHAQTGPGYPTWMIRQLFEGNAAGALFPAMYVVDVKDVALLHLAAALDPETKSTRLQTWGRNTAWNDVLAVMRRLWPERKTLDDFPEAVYSKQSTDQSQALALLKRWGGQDDWTSLASSVKDTLVTIE